MKLINLINNPNYNYNNNRFKIKEYLKNHKIISNK